MFKCNPIFAPIFTASPDVRYIHLWGGRGRGGSHFGTEYFLSNLMSPYYFRGYLMRYVLGDIRESLWRDLKDRIDEKELPANRFDINETMMSIQDTVTGNLIMSKGFKKSSGAQTAKLKSIAGATHVLIEEADEPEEADFMMLDDSLRTTKGPIQIISIFNPPKKNHHIIKNWYNLRDAKIPGYYVATPKDRSDLLSVFGTYHYNRVNLNSTTISNFERYRETKEDYYWTVIRGLVSEGAKGRIYKGWSTITNAEFNALPYPSYYGLDYGYSNDPVALLEIKAHNNRRYLRELIYEPGLTNPMLIARMRALKIGRAPIYADSAEPKSNRDLMDAGFNVIPALKGPDSVLFGIRTLQALEVAYTQDSKNIETEYQEYRWHLDSNKEPTDQPEDKQNHLHDAGRYAEITRNAYNVQGPRAKGTFKRS